MNNQKWFQFNNDDVSHAFSGSTSSNNIIPRIERFWSVYEEKIKMIIKTRGMIKEGINERNKNEIILGLFSIEDILREVCGIWNKVLCDKKWESIKHETAWKRVEHGIENDLKKVNWTKGNVEEEARKSINTIESRSNRNKEIIDATSSWWNKNIPKLNFMYDHSKTEIATIEASKVIKDGNRNIMQSNNIKCESNSENKEGERKKCVDKDKMDVSDKEQCWSREKGERNTTIKKEMFNTFKNEDDRKEGILAYSNMKNDVNCDRNNKESLECKEISPAAAGGDRSTKGYQDEEKLQNELPELHDNKSYHIHPPETPTNPDNPQTLHIKQDPSTTKTEEILNSEPENLAQDANVAKTDPEQNHYLTLNNLIISNDNSAIVKEKWNPIDTATKIKWKAQRISDLLLIIHNNIDWYEMLSQLFEGDIIQILMSEDIDDDTINDVYTSISEIERWKENDEAFD